MMLGLIVRKHKIIVIDDNNIRCTHWCTAIGKFANDVFLQEKHYNFIWVENGKSIDERMALG